MVRVGFLVNYISFSSPIGWLSVFEASGKLIAIESGKTDRVDGGVVLNGAKKQILEYFSGDRLRFSSSIELNGSKTQLAVWREIGKVPFGETATYVSIAKTIQTSPRVVGMACGRNPLPLLIPCHRIVAAKNLLGGFSFGAGEETKLYLLQLESRVKISTKHP